MLANTQLPPTPRRSIIKSGRPLTQGGSPVLGHAQRGGPADQPPPTITRELQALMADLRLEDPSRLQEVRWCLLVDH